MLPMNPPPPIRLLRVPGLRVLCLMALSLFSIDAATRSSTNYSLTTESFVPGGGVNSVSYSLGGGSLEPIAGKSNSLRL
jgi:hypothetical protein